MSNSQSGFAENKRHPTSHISSATTVRGMIITVIIIIMSCILKVGFDSLSYNNLRSKQHLKYVFPIWGQAGQSEMVLHPSAVLKDSLSNES